MSETGSLGDGKIEEIPHFDEKDDRSESADGKEFYLELCVVFFGFVVSHGFTWRQRNRIYY